MITFIGGPAGGKSLSFSRLPVMLRVVVKPDGSIDVLDQLEDKPEFSEHVWVYRQSAAPARYHIRSCGPRTGSGYQWAGQYTVLPVQPDEADVRRNDKWQAWCNANFARLLAEGNITWWEDPKP